jgi:hypothetical protein
LATYGGMRYETFSNLFKDLNISLDEFKKLALADTEKFKDSIVGAYIIYLKNLTPLHESTPLLFQAVASCSINRGESTAVKILQKVLNKNLKIDGVFGAKTHDSIKATYDLRKLQRNFVDEWIREYITRVELNARAWRDYANNPEKYKKPTILRAVFMKGWFNRAINYRN